MSDTAWEKQLSKCAEALREASKEITSAYAKAKEIYLIDATNVSSEGVNCDTMRLHCSYNLSRQDIDETLLSDFHTGESMCNFSIHSGRAVYSRQSVRKSKTNGICDGSSCRLSVPHHTVSSASVFRSGVHRHVGYKRDSAKCRRKPNWIHVLLQILPIRISRTP